MRDQILSTIFSTIYTIPRAPLQSISSNRTSRKELEPFQRGIIVGRFLAGQKKADIQREMNLPYTDG